MKKTRNNTGRSFQIDIAINFIGRILSALANIIFLPLYSKMLGPEQFGLVAFFATLQAITGLLDLGISSSSVRIIGNKTGVERTAAFLGLSKIYLAVMLAAFVVTVVLSPYASSWFIENKTFSKVEIYYFVRLAGGAILLQMIISFFSSTLIAMDKHIGANFLSSGSLITRSIVITAALYNLNKSVQTYLIANLVALIPFALYAFYLAAEKAELKRYYSEAKSIILPPKEILHSIKAMSTLALVLLFGSQYDKFLITRILGLEALGHYYLAFTLSIALNYLSVPVYNSLVPKLARLSTQNSDEFWSKLLEGNSILVRVLIPAIFFLAILSEPVLRIWTQNSLTTSAVGSSLSILAIGTGLNLLTTTIYAVQVAKNELKTCLYANIFLSIVHVTLSYSLAKRLGILGVSISWLIANVTYTITMIHYLKKYRYYLPKITKLYKDAFYSSVISISLYTLSSYFIIPLTDQRLPSLFIIALTGLVVLFLSLTFGKVNILRVKFRT